MAARKSKPAAGKAASDGRSDGRPDCSLAYELEHGSTGVPVFRPTWAEFQQFDRFIEAAQPVGAYYGILKVVAPPEHRPNKSDYKDADVHSLLVQSPVVQHTSSVAGLPGAVQVKNVHRDPRHPNITVAEFEQLSVKADAARGPRELSLVEKQDWDQLEKRFWSGTLSNRPLYGADSPGTLFDSDCTAWNVGNLPSLLHVMTNGVAGVSLPMLYFGQSRSMFSWHIEDVNLYSINYLHFGAPKQWYAVAPRHAEKFEAATQAIFAGCIPHECREFLRHKEYLVSPTKLKEYQVDFVQTRQYRGEYIVLWPKCYHAGFNYGFNCAESVNFATSAWFPIGRDCHRCTCRPDTVWISANEIANRARQLQWLQQHQRAAKKPLTLDDVPASYKLKERSIWCDLPADPIELRALASQYFAQVDSRHLEEGDVSAGRSMGKATTATAAAAADGAGADSTPMDLSHDRSAGFLFNRTRLNQLETNHSDDEDGYLADRNPAVCTYADCHTPLHKSQAALIKHYKMAHSAAARAAMAAATATAGQTTTSAGKEEKKRKQPEEQTGKPKSTSSPAPSTKKTKRATAKQ